MKKLTALILLLAITATLILTGCGNDNHPNFGEHGAKVYQPSLSAMSDEAIRIRIDELYDEMIALGRDSMEDMQARISLQLAQVLQNELLLRQLEAQNQASFDESDKQLPQSHHKKLGIKGLEHKKGIKGLQSKQGLRGSSRHTLKES
jgi:hypothetical protein